MLTLIKSPDIWSYQVIWIYNLMNQYLYLVAKHNLMNQYSYLVANHNLTRLLLKKLQVKITIYLDILETIKIMGRAFNHSLGGRKLLSLFLTVFDVLGQGGPRHFCLINLKFV